MGSDKRNNRKVIGIDLAGSPKRDMGICAMEENRITYCTIVHTDQEIVNYVENGNPAFIAVDAPLNLPPGRKSMEDRNGEHFRPCDRELLRHRAPMRKNLLCLPVLATI